MKSIIIACSAATFLVGINQTADSRPVYVGAYRLVYPNEPKQCLRCDTCHVSGVKDKKQRNKYGTAIRKALPHPDVKDKQTVMKAIKAAEKFKPKPCTSFRNWLVNRDTKPGRSDTTAICKYARETER